MLKKKKKSWRWREMHKSYCRLPRGNHQVAAPIHLILLAIFSHIEQQQLPTALSQQNLMSSCWTTALCACCSVVCLEEWPERSRSLFLKVISVITWRNNDVGSNQSECSKVSEAHYWMKMYFYDLWWIWAASICLSRSLNCFMCKWVQIRVGKAQFEAFSRGLIPWAISIPWHDNISYIEEQKSNVGQRWLLTGSTGASAAYQLGQLGENTSFFGYEGLNRFVQFCKWIHKMKGH